MKSHNGGKEKEQDEFTAVITIPYTISVDKKDLPLAWPTWNKIQKQAFLRDRILKYWGNQQQMCEPVIQECSESELID